ncbi:MAG: EamA family transporter [Acidobacteria bacterium]|nr:EamA family transporter [Acidobacteriota bacterium]
MTSAPERAAAARSGVLLYSAIAAMVLLWSANFIVGKIALREFPPLICGGLRIGLAGLFMIPAYLWQHRRAEGETWDRSDLPVLLFLGICGVALNQVLFLSGLSRTSVGHSAFVIATTPILVLLLAAAAKQEQVTPRKLAGMTIALAGVLLLNVLPASRQPGAGPSLLGDAFVFLAGLTFALFTVLGKQISRRHSAITVNAFGYVSGGLALAPLTYWASRDFSYSQVSAAGWVSLVYMALFPSVVCYLIYYYALQRISASRVSAFSYLQPALATLMAAVALGERVTLPVVAGGAVIFSGVYLAERG